MEQPTPEFTIRDGAEVFDAAGDKIGEVVRVTPDHIVVERGFFFPSDYVVPLSALAGQTADGSIRLRVTKHEVLDQGWSIAPASGETSDVPYDASGNAAYAAARREPGFDAGSPALGTTGYMGESESSPGLAADLTRREDHADSELSEQ